MSTKYEMSKTYQYRKVVKPLLERKRRARINKCLDDLKDLIAEFMQQDNNETNVKLEKADILEVTVNHLRKLKAQQQNKKNVNHPHQQQQHNHQQHNSFRSGYIQAANEVSRCLASLPKVDVIFGRRLMTHLGERLNQLEAKQQKETSTPTDKPLKINCLPSQPAATSFATQLHSPVSSGYGSDSDSSRSSPSLYAEKNDVVKVWRPW